MRWSAGFGTIVREAWETYLDLSVRQCVMTSPACRPCACGHAANGNVGLQCQRIHNIQFSDETRYLLSPDGKGCDENFIDQLLAFRSSTVVYVSCNVHTQARDVGMLLNKSEAEVKEGKKEGRYVLESVRGFDLFPQTAHVESVAVLRLVQ